MKLEILYKFDENEYNEEYIKCIKKNKPFFLIKEEKDYFEIEYNFITLNKRLSKNGLEIVDFFFKKVCDSLSHANRDDGYIRLKELEDAFFIFQRAKSYILDKSNWEDFDRGILDVKKQII